MGGEAEPAQRTASLTCPADRGREALIHYLDKSVYDKTLVRSPLVLSGRPLALWPMWIPRCFARCGPITTSCGYMQPWLNAQIALADAAELNCAAPNAAAFARYLRTALWTRGLP